MHIHFVCTGNIFRSRLAESYLLAKNLPNVSVSSSGTKANKQTKGPISWYTLRLLFRNNLLPYMKISWTQTTKQILQSQDYIICIGQGNYDFCKSLMPNHQHMISWDIPDFDDKHLNNKPFNLVREGMYLKRSEAIYARIIRNTDRFIKNYLSAHSKSPINIAK